MQAKIEPKNPIRPTITALEVGEETKFPINKMATVKTTASELGLIHGRKYTTRIDRPNETIIVTRNL